MPLFNAPLYNPNCAAIVRATPLRNWSDIKAEVESIADEMGLDKNHAFHLLLEMDAVKLEAL